MRFWMCLLLVSCAHSERKPPSEDPPKPPPVYRTVELLRREFRLGSGCGAGPFRVSIDLPEPRHRMRVSVFTVGERRIPLAIKSPFSRYQRHLEPDATCQARPGEVVAAAAPESSPRKGPRGTPVQAAPAAPELATAPPPAKELPFEVHGDAYFTSAASHRSDPDLHGSTGCWPFNPIKPGPLAVDAWLDTPYRLDGITLRVVVQEMVPIGSEEDFRRLTEERKTKDRATATALIEACRAKPTEARCFAGCEWAGRDSPNVPKSTTNWDPPPPARVEKRPARPRADAEWIAGSWSWSGTAYQWVAGFWRIPDPPPVKVAVVPTAPPPPPVEPAPPAPAPAAAPVVWVPGYWVWNGSAWTWEAGAWRVPPRPAARFIPPRIFVAPGGFRIDGGGWIFPLH